MSTAEKKQDRTSSVLKQFWAEKKNRVLTLLAGVFLAAYFIPFQNERVSAALQESFLMLGEYAREHVLLCLVPAFFIAGAVMVFLNQQAVIRYLGPDAPKPLAYGVASVSGTILAVCSCTVLPLFKGIYRKGAGIGPAIAFLYSGPAINVLAIVLTANVLGLELGLARAVGAIGFAAVIGGAMHLLYRREEAAARRGGLVLPEGDGRPLPDTVLLFALMIGVLVFANWAPAASAGGAWAAVHAWKWPATAALAAGLALLLAVRYGWDGRRMALLAAAVAALAMLFPEQPQVPFAAGVVGLMALAAMQPG